MIQRSVIASRFAFVVVPLCRAMQPWCADDVGLPLREIQSAQHGEEARVLARVVELFCNGDSETAKTLATKRAQSNPDSASGRC